MRVLANIDEFANELLPGGAIYRKMSSGFCSIPKSAWKHFVSILKQLQKVRQASKAARSTYLAFLELESCQRLRWRRPDLVENKSPVRSKLNRISVS